MKSRRTAIVAAVVAVLSACSGTPEQDDVLRFQVSGEPEETAVYTAMANAYQATHPDRQVEIVRAPTKGDHLTRLSAAFAAGNPPDVFLVNYREYAQFVARGALTPVGPGLLERGIELDDYYEQPIDAFTYDGELQCMPQNISSLVVYLNVDLFTQRDIPLPEAGWSWHDFAETARGVAEEGVHGLGMDTTLIRAAPFIWSNGGDIVDDSEQPTRLTLDTPQAREALGFLAALIRDPSLSPTLVQRQAQDLETRFVTGKVAMYLGSRRDTPKFREVRGLNTAVVPLPVGDRPAGILHSDAYCMAKDTAHPDAALDFIAYATGTRGQQITALGGRTVPSLRPVAQSSVFLDPTQQPAGSQVFLDTIDHLERTPVLPTWPEIEDIANEELQRWLHDPSLPLDEMLADLDDRTRPLFSGGSR